MSRLLTTREVCQRLQICDTYLHRLRRAQKIVAVRLGWRSVRYREEEVARFVEQRQGSRTQAEPAREDLLAPLLEYIADLKGGIAS